MTTYAPTKRQRAVYAALTDMTAAVADDIAVPLRLRGHLPPEWDEIAVKPSVARTRITIRLDTDVVRFFRALGPGYQGRISRVLRTFMLGRLSGLIEGADTRDVIAAAPTPDKRGKIERTGVVRRAFEREGETPERALFLAMRAVQALERSA